MRFSADGNDQPILPPRIPQCTPDAIRRYIANPPNFSKLEVGERLPDQSMSDDERLRMNAQIAENNRVAHESHLSAMELARQAMQQGRTMTATLQVAEAAGAGTTGVDPTPSAIPTASSPAAAPQPAEKPITQQQMLEILSVMKQFFPTGQAAMEWLQSNYETTDPARLTGDQADNILVELLKRLADQKIAASQANAPAPSQETLDGPAATRQREEIKSLTVHIYAEQAAEAQDAFLRSLGLTNAAGLTYTQAQARVEQLKADPRASDWAPF